MYKALIRWLELPKEILPRLHLANAELDGLVPQKYLRILKQFAPKMDNLSLHAYTAPPTDRQVLSLAGKRSELPFKLLFSDLHIATGLSDLPAVEQALLQEGVVRLKQVLPVHIAEQLAEDLLKSQQETDVTQISGQVDMGRVALKSDIFTQPSSPLYHVKMKLLELLAIMHPRRKYDVKSASVLTAPVGHGRQVWHMDTDHAMEKVFLMHLTPGAPTQILDLQHVKQQYHSEPLAVRHMYIARENDPPMADGQQCQPGDATLMAANRYHRGPQNDGPDERRMLFLLLSSQPNAVVSEDYQVQPWSLLQLQHGIDHEAFLRSLVRFSVAGYAPLAHYYDKKRIVQKRLESATRALFEDFHLRYKAGVMG